MFADGRERLESTLSLVAPKAHVTLADLGAKVLEQALHVNEELEVGKKERVTFAHVNYVFVQGAEKVTKRVMTSFVETRIIFIQGKGISPPKKLATNSFCIEIALM